MEPSSLREYLRLSQLNSEEKLTPFLNGIVMREQRIGNLRALFVDGTGNQIMAGLLLVKVRPGDEGIEVWRAPTGEIGRIPESKIELCSRALRVWDESQSLERFEAQFAKMGAIEQVQRDGRWSEALRVPSPMRLESGTDAVNPLIEETLRSSFYIGDGLEAQYFGQSMPVRFTLKSVNPECSQSAELRFDASRIGLAAIKLAIFQLRIANSTAERDMALGRIGELCHEFTPNTPLRPNSLITKLKERIEMLPEIAVEAGIERTGPTALLRVAHHRDSIIIRYRAERSPTLGWKSLFITSNDEGDGVVKVQLGNHTHTAKGSFLFDLRELGSANDRLDVLFRIAKVFSENRFRLPGPFADFLVHDAKGPYFSTPRWERFNTRFLEPGGAINLFEESVRAGFKGCTITPLYEDKKSTVVGEQGSEELVLEIKNDRTGDVIVLVGCAAGLKDIYVYPRNLEEYGADPVPYLFCNVSHTYQANRDFHVQFLEMGHFFAGENGRLTDYTDGKYVVISDLGAIQFVRFCESFFGQQSGPRFLVHDGKGREAPRRP
jgi:hypothetical protein